MSWSVLEVTAGIMGADSESWHHPGILQRLPKLMPGLSGFYALHSAPRDRLAPQPQPLPNLRISRIFALGVQWRGVVLWSL
jgi:hypothetical protein